MDVAFLETLAVWMKMDAAWLVIALGMMWTYKYVAIRYESRKMRRTETLDKLRLYLDKPMSHQDTLMKEMLFEDHFGVLLSWQEVEFFRNAQNPLRKLRNYMHCKSYLEFDSAGQVLRIISGKNMMRAKWLNGIAYLITSFVFSGMVLGAHTVFMSNGPSMYAAWSVTLLCAGGLAVISLHQYFMSDAAIKLVADCAKR
jgi:hypothetical protein